MTSVKINPQGQRQHDHTIHAKINNASIYAMEDLLGDRHSEGEPGQQTAEWYLVTPHGSATIHDYWSFNEGEYAIRCANDRVATIVVDWLREHRIAAHLKPQL